MLKPPAPIAPSAVNVDTATLVKRTRWHIKPEQMILNGVGAGSLAAALKDQRPIFPSAECAPIDDPVTARAMLEEADPRLLLMSLMHLTGDEALLDRFAPYIGAQFAGGAKGVATAAIPDEMQAELRDELVRRLAQPGGAVEAPISAGLAQRMMSVCVGERVGDEFVPLLLEQAGFTGVQGVEETRRGPINKTLRILIIGAGMSGIALGAKLGELGYDFTIVDQNEEFGGTWWVNRYPGVGVDTPSHYYSFSFDINPDWPRYFSKGPVLQDYFKASAEKFGLRARTRFNTRVAAVSYDDASGRWTAKLEPKGGGEETAEFDVVIAAIAPTNEPLIPDFKGIDRFKGLAAHTARWPEVDLKGKRVAVIGTGASSMQVCTTIAPDAEHLTIFQRSRHWIIPSPLASKEVPEGARWAMRHVPHYAQWQRFITYWTGSDGTYSIAVIDPNWPMQDVSVSEASERRRQILLNHINTRLAGRDDLIDIVTPNYPPMGKRIILDSGWLDMLRRDNVEITETGIDHIEEDAIVLADGRRVEVDVIVIATGFVFRPQFGRIAIGGRGGQTLAEAWGDEDPRAYLGLMVPGFPNFFVMNGPNGNPSHGAGNNLMAEAATTYVLGALDLLASRGARTIEPDPQAFNDYNDALDTALAGMVWSHPRVQSYYINSRRRNTVSCPWRLVDYWWMMRHPNPDDMVFG